MKKLLWLSFIPSLLWGAAGHLPETQPEEKLIEKTEALAQPRNEQNIPKISSSSSQPVVMDKEALLANPALLKRAMNSVLLTKQIEGIRAVLPIYRDLADADKHIIHYGEALLAHYQGQLKTAINLYRKIIAEQPEMSSVRLDLAMALYANRQGSAASDQLKRLQSEDLPKPIENLVTEVLNNIQKQEAWQFSADFYYRQENNINDAPEQQQLAVGSGTLTFPKAEKAHGFHLNVGAKKRFNWSDNIYTHVELEASSDFYWDNHQYDDLTLKAATGIGYQNAKLTAEIQPFIKKRFYGTDPYSLTSGASGLLSYRLTPQWQFSNFTEWSYENFDDRKHLNGQRLFSGLSAVYIRNPQQYWSAGLNYFNSEAKMSEDSYHRIGAFVGWGQEWPKGFSSKLTLSAGERRYDGVDFFNVKRQDKEYGAKLALWHRAVHYWGITPRIVWSWDRTDSNHFYYDKTDSRINVEFSKTF